MGYLKRKRSKQRCAAAAAAAARERLPADFERWMYATSGPTTARADRTFFRLTVEKVHAHSHQPMGIFQFAGELEDSGRLLNDDCQRLRRALNWFNGNLIVPRDVEPAAIFWFGAEAKDCLRSLWRIVRLLRDHDHAVWVLRTDRPGRVVYRDALQIAAVPWRDRAWERAAMEETTEL